MKCCSRSTTWRVSALLLGACVAAPAAAQPAAADEAAARLAIIRAVQAKMGGSAVVSLEQLSVTLPSGRLEDTTSAAPEPGARTGRPIRFTLFQAGPAGPARLGSATALVRVALPHTRAARAVPRGTELADTDLAVSSEDVGSVALSILPLAADLAGGRTVRDLRAGEVLTAALVRAQPLVKAGDLVRTTVRVGRVEAAGTAVAQQSGRRNDRIRVVNTGSRRTLIGRVTGAGEVEVIHVL